MAKKRNYDTYEGSDVYIECPWCGRRDMCGIGSCLTYNKEQISKIVEQEQREEKEEKKEKRSKQG
ncbi:9140_t:CDS:1, partial [Cetraspora pellucida]